MRIKYHMQSLQDLCADSFHFIISSYFIPDRYVGHHMVPSNWRVSDLCALLNVLKGFPPNTSLLLYEEVRPTMVWIYCSFTDTHFACLLNNGFYRICEGQRTSTAHAFEGRRATTW